MAKKRPLVSAVIPCFNRVDSTIDTINSLLKASFNEGLEIIVVDDGSTDGTEKKVKKLISEQKSKNIKLKYIKQKNSGAASARNTGALNAKGDLLFFIDNDCLADRNCLAQLVKEIKKNKKTAIIGCKIIGVENTFFSKCYDYSHYSGFMTNKKEKRDFLCSSAIIVNKDIFFKQGMFDISFRIGEEEDLGLRLSQAGYKLIYLPEAMVFHKHSRKNFIDFIKHPMRWAKLGSVEVFLKHKGYKHFASSNPYSYLIFSLPIASLVTLKIVNRLIREKPSIIVYSPFIFLNKVVWCIGTFIYLNKKKN